MITQGWPRVKMPEADTTCDAYSREWLPGEHLNGPVGFFRYEYLTCEEVENMLSLRGSSQYMQ